MKKSVKILLIVALLVILVIVILIIKSNHKIVVCIDAGHGGDDVGAILDKRYEKDDTFEIAKLVKNI